METEQGWVGSGESRSGVSNDTTRLSYKWEVRETSEKHLGYRPDMDGEKTLAGVEDYKVSSLSNQEGEIRKREEMESC